MCPGPFGATMITSTSGGGTTVLKWMANPCENSSVLPFTRWGATSCSYTSAIFKSGTARKITSASLTASAGVHHGQALLRCHGPRRAAGIEPDDDVHAAVLEVERVGVSLRPEADDRAGLGGEQGEIGVFVGVNFGAAWGGWRVASAAARRGGLRVAGVKTWLLWRRQTAACADQEVRGLSPPATRNPQPATVPLRFVLAAAHRDLAGARQVADAEARASGE